MEKKIELKESQDERMAVLIAETIFCVYGESQEYKDVVAWLKEHMQVDILDEDLDTPEEPDVYLELHRIMSEEREPTCKDCDFYDNDCPFVRGRFVPYPEKICKDYTCSRVKEQSQELEIAVNNAAEKYEKERSYNDYVSESIKMAFKAGVAWATRYNNKEK